MTHDDMLAGIAAIEVGAELCGWLWQLQNMRLRTPLPGEHGALRQRARALGTRLEPRIL